MTNEKMLTVIMPVYNGSKYVKQTVDSILNQRFDNFIFLIIDDGSTDDTINILSEIKDGRIKIIRREHLGIIDSFNYALSISDSKYLARIDADDIYYENKFQKQIDLLENNEEIILVGTDAYYMSAKGIVSKIRAGVPEKHNDIVNNLIKRKRGLIQSTFMARSEILKYKGGYRKGIYPEDYDLFFRLSKYGKLCNITEPLAAIRIHKSFSHKNLGMLINNHDRLISEYTLINNNKSKLIPLKYRASYLSIYLNRIGLYYFLNVSRILSIPIFLLSLIFSPINSSKVILNKISASLK